MSYSMIVTSATGSGLKRTIPALQSSNIVKVIGAQGRSSQKLDGLKSQYNLSVSTDLEALVSRLDSNVLYVASPPFLHKEQVLTGIKYGKIIICEKPLSLSIDDSVEIYKAVKKSGTKFMLAHHLRHQKCVEDIKSIINSKTLGKVKGGHFQWNFMLNQKSANASWKLDSTVGSKNSFFDAGIHAIDMAMCLFGIPKEVFANGFNNIKNDYYDSVDCQLIYDGYSIMSSSSQTQTTIGNDINIYLEKGSIFVKNAFSEKSSSEIIIESEGNGRSVVNFGETNLYKNEVENFLHSLGNEYLPFYGTSIDEALSASYILDAISNSITCKSIQKVLSHEVIV